MNCPRCGYTRPDFDTYCLRCRLMDAQGVRPRPPVAPADQTIVMNDLPGVPPPSVHTRSHAWVFALLALLALLIGTILLNVVFTPHPPHADTSLASGSHTPISS